MTDDEAISLIVHVALLFVFLLPIAVVVSNHRRR